MRSPSSKHLSPLTKLNHFDEVLDTTGDRQGSQKHDQSECDRTSATCHLQFAAQLKSLAGVALSKLARSKLALDRHTNWATYPCTPEATVAAGVLREVLLMIIFSEVKLGCCENFGCNFAVLRLAQSLLVGITRCFC